MRIIDHTRFAVRRQKRQRWRRVFYLSLILLIVVSAFGLNYARPLPKLSPNYSRDLQLLQTEDSDGPTYAVQFYAASLGDFENYLAHHAEHFRQQTAERWGGDFIAFNTIMEVIV